MNLSIVIPALNEEASIVRVIEDTLGACEYIRGNSPVKNIEITVVSDGSTDRTVELSRPYIGRIKLIEFEVNKGYGAAIKQGWLESDGDVLGFMDADGTCDARFFAQLCTALDADGAGMALGTRMGDRSEMPFIRRIGNTLFAAMVSFMSSSRVTDIASGMRVLRRSCIDQLMPLPDGLHFTPCMSVRAIMSGDVSIAERVMPYHERVGRSKLSVVRDGMRFLGIIVSISTLYRPDLFLKALGVVLMALTVAIGILPGVYYLEHGKLLEWMIYRFVVMNILTVLGAMSFSAAYLTSRMVRITLLNKYTSLVHPGILGGFFRSRLLWITTISCMGVGFALVFGSLLDRIMHGTTTEHWSRYIAMSTLFAVASVILFTKIIDHILKLVAERKMYLSSLLK